MAIKNSKHVMVCDKCFRASCWYGEFMCDDARGAGTVVKTAGELKKLKLENPCFWSAEKFLEVYGTTTPDFARVLPRGAVDAAINARMATDRLCVALRDGRTTPYPSREVILKRLKQISEWLNSIAPRSILRGEEEGEWKAGQ